MAAAGQIITAGRIPGERIATASITSDSASITTTETSIASVTATLVAGRTYRIKYVTRIGTGTAGTVALIRIREDTVGGTELVGDNIYLGSGGGAGNGVMMEGEYTAAATGAKTFHLTLQRASATGDVRREGSFMPTYLYVEYISG